MSEQINVNHAFEPELRQAQADFDAYIETRPYQGEDGKIYSSDGDRIKKKEIGAYFDQARDGYYDESQETPYAELSLSELADDLAYAELTEDKTKIEDLSDALLDKMDSFASAQVTERNPNGMDADAQMSLFDRVMKLKDQKKVKYLETNGYEISDRVRSEVLASTNGSSDPESGAATEPVAEAEVSEKPSMEEMEAEFIDKLKAAGQADAEGRIEDSVRLFQEAQEQGSVLFKAQIADRLNRVHEANKARDYVAVDTLEDEMMSILDSYLKLNNIKDDSDEAKVLREKLQYAIAGWIDDIFAEDIKLDGDSSEEDSDSIPVGTFDGDDVLPDVSGHEEESDDAYNDEAEEPIQPKSRWQRIKAILGFEGERQDGRVSRSRKFMGTAALVGAGLVAGFLVGNATRGNGYETISQDTTVEAPTTTTPQDELPTFVQQEIAQNETLEAAGVSDESVRADIIHNPEDFKRMVENPEQFAAMLKWHNTRVEELIQNDPTLSREAAQKQAEKQFRDFVEDLDDQASA